MLQKGLLNLLRIRVVRIYNQCCLLKSNQNRATAMIICVCRRISDRDIVRHARAGMGFDEIQFELGVATQCGRCEGCVRDVVAQCSATCPTAYSKQTALLLASHA